jgi:hypothetical protein
MALRAAARALASATRPAPQAWRRGCTSVASKRGAGASGKDTQATGADAAREGFAGTRARGCSTAAAVRPLAAEPVVKAVPDALAVPLGPTTGAARAVASKLTAGSRFLLIALTCNRFIML